MKAKYRKYTAKYCENLAMIHEYSSSVKMYIFENYTYYLMRKKCDDSKHLYHYRKNIYLDAYMDVRRGRRILANTRMFEEFFNAQCDFLSRRIEYERKLKSTFKVVKVIPTEELCKIKLNEDLKNLIGEVKCLPI